jgi:hypothetical protein
MIMRRILFISGVLSLFFLFMGCREWLDVKPESETILDDYWQNETQANQIVMGCYRALTLDVTMERIMAWGELMSDNVAIGNGMHSDMQKIINVDITATNEFCKWAPFYSIINYCNTFLHFGPGVVEKDPNFTMSKYNALKAEVLTIRALSYFYLVRAFKEVPWISTPSINDTQDYNIAKSPEQAVLDSITTNLREALSLARNSYGSIAETKGRITKNAIMALLADIYLWQGKYLECVNMCNPIISDPQYKLVKAENVLYNVFCLGNSTESIFELQFENTVQYNIKVLAFYGYNNDGKLSGDWLVPEALMKPDNGCPFKYAGSNEIESADDVREKDFVKFLTAERRYGVNKYMGLRVEKSDGNSTYEPIYKTANWIFYRLSDVILMKAEALVQLNRSETDLQEALKMVNTTYLRSNPNLGSDSLKFENYNNAKSLESLVLRERERELMYEGKRWFDLVRMARRVGTTDPVLYFIRSNFAGDVSMQISKMSDMEALYLPIHKDELDANSALKQSDFYGVAGGSNSKNN